MTAIRGLIVRRIDELTFTGDRTSQQRNADLHRLHRGRLCGHENAARKVGSAARGGRWLCCVGSDRGEASRAHGVTMFKLGVREVALEEVAPRAVLLSWVSHGLFFIGRRVNSQGIERTLQ